MELGHLLERNGLAVCEQVGPAKALTTIGHQISDRDNAVRSAALDVVVIVYNIVGDDVYKLMSSTNDKNVSLMQERIKRAGKREPPSVATAGGLPSTLPTGVPTEGTISLSKDRKSAGGVRATRGAPGAGAGNDTNNVDAIFSLDLEDLHLPPAPELVRKLFLGKKFALCLSNNIFPILSNNIFRLLPS